MPSPALEEVAPTATHELLVGHDTAFKRPADLGMVGALHVVPLSAVERTTPELDDVDPATTHPAEDAHATPLIP